MKYIKKLIGENIYLALRSLDDAEQYTIWLNDFNVSDYIGRSSQVFSVEAEKKYLEQQSEDDCAFGIVTLNGDRLIGTIDLQNIDKINRTAVLGIFIGDQEYREKGLGTEAIRLLLDFGFNYLNLHSIKLDLMEFNERAYKCYTKCGFKEIGRRRECKYINGKYYDSISMDILKDEFTESYIRNKII